MRFKKSKIISLVLILSISSIYVFHLAYNAHLQSSTRVESVEEISVTFSGNIENPGKKFFQAGTSLKEAMNGIVLKRNTSLETLSLNRELKNNEFIYIPRRNQKFISWNDLKMQDLNQVKISELLKNKIMKYFHGTKNPQWNELLNIKGVGEKTIEKLQDILTLTPSSP